MKEKLFIFGALALLVALLVGLNAASYIQKEKIPDSEARPNRSSYNTGPTGTRAFHDLLAATGHQVERWEQPVSELTFAEDSAISTFVIVGRTRKDIQDDEIKQLLQWVEFGGRLVIVDRRPPLSLLETSASWRVRIEDVDGAFSAGELEVLLPTVDPSNSTQMTDGENAVRSLQPSVFTVGVNAVQPSKFATSILLERRDENSGGPDNSGAADRVITPPEEIAVSEESGSGAGEKPYPNADSGAVAPAESILPAPTGEPTVEVYSGEPDPAPSDIQTGPINGRVESAEDEEIDQTRIAPVVHFGNNKKKILADFPYGIGSIAVLSDPYIISNGGVSLVDNAQMAVNVVASDGIIAFDEYHQGFGSNQNRLLNYFYATPVVPVFLQLVLLVGLIMLSLSRRFARPIPLREPNRITNLEYVAAMAQLKRRTKAFDLAVENIYTDFRRRVTRLVGIDNQHSQNRELAEAISMRTDYKPEEIEEIMYRCEDIVHGEATNRKTVLDLAVKIRNIESALGLRRKRTIFRK